MKRGAYWIHSHRQFLHLASAQPDGILVPNAADNLTDQLVIESLPRPSLRVAGYITGIPDRSVQICIKPFRKPVNELFGAGQSRRRPDPSFIVCVLRVPECNVIPDLLRIRACVSD